MASYHISGGMVISGGVDGDANNTNILSGGQIISGDSALNNDIVYVYSGGSANDVEITNGNVYIYSGATADNIGLNGGAAYVSGAVVTNLTVSKGNLEISQEGGLVNGASVANGATHVLSGASAQDLTVSANGRVYVSGGAAVTNADITSNGYITVYESGTLTSGVVYDNGKLYVSSGATVNNLIWTPGNGNVVIEQGAEITFGAEGKTAEQAFSGVYWGKNGAFVASSGGMITSLEIVQSAQNKIANWMNTSLGAMVDDALTENNLNYNYTISEVSPDDIDFGIGSYDGASLVGSMYVMSGGCVLGLPVTSGDMHVWGGGSGAFIAVSGADARLFVSGGATVYGAAAAGVGTIEVLSGGKILNGGKFEANFGTIDVPPNPVKLEGANSLITGVVNNKYKEAYTNNMSGAQQQIVNALSNKIDGGVMAVGTVAKVNVHNGGYVEDAYVATYGSMSVAGEAKRVTVENGGTLIVQGDSKDDLGIATKVSFYGKAKGVYSTTVYESGAFKEIKKLDAPPMDSYAPNYGIVANVVVANNGVAEGVGEKVFDYAQGGGNITVLSGGVARNFHIAGEQYLLDDRFDETKEKVWQKTHWLTSETYSAGSMTVANGGYVENITVGGARMVRAYNLDGTPGSQAAIIEKLGSNAVLTLNGSASNTKVSFGGLLTVGAGGVASGVELTQETVQQAEANGGSNFENVTVGGSAVVLAGGMMKDISMMAQNTDVVVSSGGIVAGKITMVAQNLTFEAGGILDFSVYEYVPGDDYLVKDYKFIKGTPELSITVSEQQANGTYYLAQGAENYKANTVITVNAYQADGSLVNYGKTMANSDALGYDKKFYSVSYDGRYLQLTVSSGDLFDAVLTSPTVTVSNVDGGNNEIWTNKSVTVTAEFTPVSVKNEYKIGEDGAWKTYLAPITVTSNATLYFRATDSIGRTSEVVEKVVSKIDTIKADFDLISFNDEGRFSEYVDVRVENVTDKMYDANGEIVDGSGASNISYSFDQSSWIGGSTVRVSENKKVYFRVVDNAGNVTTKTFDVTCIGDTFAPVAAVTGNAADWTKEDIVLTVAAQDAAADADGNKVQVSGIYSFEYRFDGGEWQSVAAEDITFANNNASAVGKITVSDENVSTVDIRVFDAARNEYTFDTIAIDKVDKSGPTLELSANVTEGFTNGGVKISADAADLKSGMKVIEFKDANGNWISDVNNVFEVYENGIYEFRAVDNVGNVTEDSIEINCIDAIAPEVTVSLDPELDGWSRDAVTITVTATDEGVSGFNKLEYSFDNATWVEIASGKTFVVNEKSTYYFRASDNAGNFSKTEKVDIKIDNVAPALDIEGNSADWTNQKLTLTAYATDADSAIKAYYYIDANGNWAEGSSLEVTANGTYTFKAVDNAGNEVTKDIVVDRIDTVLPELTVTGNATVWTKEDVVLNVSATDAASGIRAIEYTVDDGATWNKITDGTVTVSQAQIVRFRAIDVAGNISRIFTADVNLIDKDAPVITVEGNTEDWTNKSVKVAVSAADSGSGLEKLEYSYNNNLWFAINSGDEIKVDKNGTVYVKATDKLGQVSTKEVVIGNIDTVKPEVEVAGNAVEWTKNDVVLSCTSKDDASGVSKVEYSYDSKNWFTVTGNTVSVEYNAIVNFRVTDNAGNVSDNVEVVVNKIDKSGPALTISGDTQEPTRKGVQLVATAVDGADESGISKVEYSFDNKTWNAGTTVTVSENKTVYFRATDNAGNVVVDSIDVNNIITTTASNNLLSNGTSQILAWDVKKGTVGYVAVDGEVSPEWCGVWEWNRGEAKMWKVVGAGLFAGSEAAHDGILLYNGIGNTFAAWTDINQGDYGYVSLCHVDGNFNTTCLTDLDSDKYDDVLIHDEKGSFGVVLDGASYKDIWHSEDAETNPWELVGAGSFGGNEDKLIVKNESGHLYLWTNNDKTFNTWDWSQEEIGFLGNDWEYVACGDFQGDGTDDIVVRKLSDKGLWVWDNGDSATAHWVGTPGNGFSVEAVGDYNGDGKDDLLLREYTTGWGGLGYWASADANQWNDLNARVETGFDSNFSIIA